MGSAIDMHENWIHPETPANYGGVKVTYFSNPYPTFSDMSNLSLVTFLEYDGCGIVIPGDLERAVGGTSETAIFLSMPQRDKLLHRITSR